MPFDQEFRRLQHQMSRFQHAMDRAFGDPFGDPLDSDFGYPAAPMLLLTHSSQEPVEPMDVEQASQPQAQAQGAASAAASSSPEAKDAVVSSSSSSASAPAPAAAAGSAEEEKKQNAAPAADRRIARSRRDLWPFSAMTSSMSQLCPACDVRETEKEFLLNAELPGVPKENIKLNIDASKRTLTLSAEKKEEFEAKEEKDNYHRFERRFGTFQRSMVLPDNADLQNITAAHNNGVLTVSIAKLPADKLPERSRAIQIN